MTLTAYTQKTKYFTVLCKPFQDLDSKTFSGPLFPRFLTYLHVLPRSSSEFSGFTDHIIQVRHSLVLLTNWVCTQCFAASLPCGLLSNACTTRPGTRHLASAHKALLLGPRDCVLDDFSAFRHAFTTIHLTESSLSFPVFLFTVNLFTNILFSGNRRAPWSPVLFHRRASLHVFSTRFIVLT